MSAFDDRWRALARSARRAPERAIPPAPPYLAARARAMASQTVPRSSVWRLAAAGALTALLYVAAIPYSGVAVSSIALLDVHLPRVPAPPALPAIEVPAPPTLPTLPELPPVAGVAATFDPRSTHR
ncbi:MAG: hypothetical protein U0166_06720 [Acidobacteriota bacterium]